MSGSRIIHMLINGVMWHGFAHEHSAGTWRTMYAIAFKSVYRGDGSALQVKGTPGLLGILVEFVDTCQKCNELELQVTRP